MVHVEDSETWPSDPADVGELPRRIGNLAGSIGPGIGGHGVARGAKLSVQFGNQFLNQQAAQPYVAPSSLSMVLSAGGNFWMHLHNATFDALSSVTTQVYSAFLAEGGASTGSKGAGMGRSGGADTAVGRDWVSINVGAGLPFKNSTTMKLHGQVPTSARPYGFDNTQLDQYYAHDAAPGPIHADIMTMRAHVFWMTRAESWFGMADTIYPNATYEGVGSVLMMPQASRWSLAGMADKRTAWDVDTLTGADLTAALTEVWTQYMLMTSYMQSVNNVWYRQLGPRFINAGTIQSICAFVDSVNDILTVGAADGTRRGEWRNMNEIGSLAFHATSKYY